MKYEEYKNIINSGIVEYVKNGGSTYYMGNALIEYFFEYDKEPIPHDAKNNLSDKAVQAIDAHKPLPEGIRLVKCVLNERRDC